MYSFPLSVEETEELIAGAQTVDQIDYENEDGSNCTLCLNDVVQMGNGDIGAATLLYENGIFVLWDMTSKKHVWNVFRIQKNMSVLTEKELVSKNRDRHWKKGMQVDVYSNTLKRWCPGEISEVFELKSDGSIAHGDKWFQLKYFNFEKETYQFKQLPCDSEHLRRPKRVSKTFSSDEFPRSASESSYQHCNSI